MPSWIHEEPPAPADARLPLAVGVVGLPGSGRTAALAGFARATEGGCLPSAQHAVWLAEPVPELYALADRERALVLAGGAPPDEPPPRAGRLRVRIHAERIGGPTRSSRPAQVALRFARGADGPAGHALATVLCVDAMDRAAAARLGELAAEIPANTTRVLVALTKSDRLVSWAGSLVSPRRLLGALDPFTQAESLAGAHTLRAFLGAIAPEVDVAITLTSAWGVGVVSRRGGAGGPARPGPWSPVGLAEAAVWLAFGAVLPGVRPVPIEERGRWRPGGAPTRPIGRLAWSTA